MARKKLKMLLTTNDIGTRCLHAESCEHGGAIAEATEITTMLVMPDDVAQLRAAGVFVDQAGCVEGTQ